MKFSDGYYTHHPMVGYIDNRKVYIPVSVMYRTDRIKEIK